MPFISGISTPGDLFDLVKDLDFDLAAAPDNAAVAVVLFDITGAGVFIGAGGQLDTGASVQIQLTLDGAASGFALVGEAAGDPSINIPLFAPFKTSGKLEMKLAGAGDGFFWGTVLTR
jgi:hypothetical protein